MTKAPLPLVSIVVVNYNGQRFLKDCFDSLYALNYPANQLEIFMIDNCSEDNSLDYVQRHYPDIKLVENNENNYCKANNLGIARSRGEYVAFLNNDTKVDRDWLIELVELIESDRTIGAIGSKILFMDGSIQSVGHQEYPNFYWGDRGFEEEDKGQYDYIREVPSICGAAGLYRKECLDDVGLLDEDFNMFLEDVDLGIRCRKKNWKLLFCPKSVVYHQFHGSIGDEEAARFMREKNRLLLIAKHWPDRLAEAFAGRDYFARPYGYTGEKDIFSIISSVYMKLVKTHGIDMATGISDRLFESLRKTFNLEKDFLAQQSRTQKTEIENLRHQLDLEIQKTRELRSQLEAERTIASHKLTEKQAHLESQTQRTRELQHHLDLETQKTRELQSQLETERIETIQKLKEKQFQLDLEHQKAQALQVQIKSVRNELEGVYSSTGFRFILRPLWGILWPTKQAIRRFWQGLVMFRRLPAYYLGKIIRYVPRPLELVSKTRHRVNTAAADNQWAKAYLSHIYRNTFPPPPQKLNLMLTKRCNLSCAFCNFPDANYKTEDMPREEAFKAIDSAANLGIKDLEITGGEPLLHPELFEIIDYAKSKSMLVHITTNGILLSRHIEQIARSEPKTFCVSVDGGEGTHDELRGFVGCYEKVMEGIEALQRRTPDIVVTVSFVITNKNVHELRRVYNHFKSRGIKVYFWPVNNQPQFYLTSRPDKKNYVDFVKRLLRAQEISPYHYRYYIVGLRYFEGQRLKVRCLGLAQELAVDVDGNILPCCVWERGDSGLGNIGKDDLEILWHSDRFHKERKDIFNKGCDGSCFNTALCEFNRITGLDFLIEPRPYKANRAETSQSKIEFSAENRLPQPRLIHIKPTSRCNLSCRHCDLWKSNRQKELSSEEWKSIISKVYNWLGPFRLEIAGGEPFLYKDITEIIKYSSGRQIFTVLTTNAALINEELAREIVDSGLSTINISLDAESAGLHDYIRGKKGVFDKAINAIDLLRGYRSQKSKPHICIAVTVIQQNLKDLLKLADYVDKGLADSINFQALGHNFGADYQPDWFKDNEFWVKDTDKLEEVISELKSLKRSGVNINNPLSQLDAIRTYFKDHTGFNQAVCDTGYKNFIIETNGDVHPCWNMPAVGNILKEEPEKIWRSSSASERRGEILKCIRTCRILNCNF